MPTRRRSPSNNLRRPTVHCAPGSCPGVALANRSAVFVPASSFGMRCADCGLDLARGATLDPEAVAKCMSDDVAAHQPSNGRKPSTTVPRRAAAPPSGGRDLALAVADGGTAAARRSPPSGQDSGTTVAWRVARNDQESRLRRNWARQLLAMALEDHAARRGVIGAACARASATRALERGVLRELGEEVACLGLDFVTASIDALARQNGGHVLTPAEQELCQRVHRVAGAGGIDPTRVPALAPAVTALGRAPPAALLEATPGPAAAAPDQSLEGAPGPTPDLESWPSPASDDAQEVGVAPGPGGAAATQPSAAATSSRGREPRKKKRRSGTNSRYAARAKKRAASGRA